MAFVLDAHVGSVFVLSPDIITPNLVMPVFEIFPIPVAFRAKLLYAATDQAAIVISDEFCCVVSHPEIIWSPVAIAVLLAVVGFAIVTLCEKLSAEDASPNNDKVAAEIVSVSVIAEVSNKVKPRLKISHSPDVGPEERINAHCVAVSSAFTPASPLLVAHTSSVPELLSVYPSTLVISTSGSG